MNNYNLKNFIMEGGDRSCLLFQKNGFPLLYANIFINNEVRNNGCTVTTMKSVAKSLNIFLVFLGNKSINLEDRIIRKEFLSRDEIREIINHMSLKKNSGNVIDFSKNDRIVSSGTKYYRTIVAFKYIKWLCEYLLGSNTYIDREAINFLNMLKAYNPKKRIADDFYTRKPKTLDDNQKTALFRYVSVKSVDNIYNQNVRKRNELIILLLYSLGLRKGELLNLRITDIDMTDNIISIKRRHGDQLDSRVNQPVVKTLNRDMQVSGWIIDKIYNYIQSDRRDYIGRKRHDFLFINHRRGTISGQPMSIDSYEKTIQKIREHDPILNNFTGHALRHTWNYEFSSALEKIDSKLLKMNPELIRSYAMGWSPHSDMAKIYNSKYFHENMLVVLSMVQKNIQSKLEDKMYELQ